MDPAWENAIKQGENRLVRDLLEGGANPDARDRYGQTGLMLAAHGGHREIVETLIAQGADLNITAKFGLSALMLAIVAGHREIARLLAGAGADLTLRGSGAPGFAGKTAGDLALERGWLELATELRATPGRGNDADQR
jgi:ankyrin repeat protein